DGHHLAPPLRKGREDGRPRSGRGSDESPMTRTIRAAVAVLVPALLLLGLPPPLAVAIPAALPAQQRDTFPHERHSPLFPSCTGCHEGIVTGEAVRARPAASQCAACH